MLKIKKMQSIVLFNLIAFAILSSTACTTIRPQNVKDEAIPQPVAVAVPFPESAPQPAPAPQPVGYPEYADDPKTELSGEIPAGALPPVAPDKHREKHSAPLSPALTGHEAELVDPVDVGNTNIIENKPNLDSYIVTVSARKKLAMPETGELNVWIGLTEEAPEIDADMVAKTRELRVTGETALVKPYVNGMKVEPESSQCVRIHPSGSNVRFKLIPIDAGDFLIGADIMLYSSNDCSGAPIPKSAKSIKINVSVNWGLYTRDKIYELLIVAWSAFLSFWGNFLALTFALILFIFRKKIFEKFGYDGKT